MPELTPYQKAGYKAIYNGDDYDTEFEYIGEVFYYNLKQGDTVTLATDFDDFYPVFRIKNNEDFKPRLDIRRHIKPLNHPQAPKFKVGDLVTPVDPEMSDKYGFFFIEAFERNSDDFVYIPWSPFMHVDDLKHATNADLKVGDRVKREKSHIEGHGTVSIKFNNGVKVAWDSGDNGIYASFGLIKLPKQECECGNNDPHEKREPECNLGASEEGATVVGKEEEKEIQDVIEKIKEAEAKGSFLGKLRNNKMLERDGINPADFKIPEPEPKRLFSDETQAEIERNKRWMENNGIDLSKFRY